ncbi:TolC family protein [Massilia sp. TWP1-3-3]|uniref:TolC family protein n=1 Tax=Massilia sp. TWP1-3-3 TaxID=2804573 RepID=UPI003CEF177F
MSVLVGCWCPASAGAAAAHYALVDVVRLALENNADVLVQGERVAAAQGQVQQAAGKFDLGVAAGMLQSRTVTPLAPLGANGLRQTSEHLVQYTVGANQLQRNGNTLETALTADSLRQDVSGGGLEPARNLLRLSMALNMPLLKGRGKDVATLEVATSGMRLQISRYERRFRVSQVMQATLGAYWDYVARSKLEMLAQATAQRSAQLLASTEKLVEANERPRGDLVLLRADYVDKAAAALRASQALVEARRNLARLMGIEGNAAAAMALEQEAFPPQADAIARLVSLAPALSTLVAQGRADILGMELEREQASLQRTVARKNLQPQLDLSVGVAYGKASEGGSRYGFPGEAGQTPNTPSVFARLQYQFPVQNNVAKGQYAERNAQLGEMEIRVRDAHIAASNGVLTAVQRLAASAAQLRAAKESLSLYEQAVNQEMTKQKNGIATLIDVITIEGRYNLAQVNAIELHADYAKALVNLQHETGTMLRPALGPGVVAAAGAGPADEFAVNVRDLSGLAPVFDVLKVPL